MTEAIGQIKDDFDWFRSECIKLRNTYNTYLALFEGGTETEELLQRNAELFFTDLNEWLIQLIFIQAGRLTDPETTRGKPNLTVEHFVSKLFAEDLLDDEIEMLACKLHGYRRKILAARNKSVAHLDVSIIRRNLTLGEHLPAEATDFFKNLNEFTDAVGKAIGVGPLDYSVQAGPGDVVDLIRLLRDHENMKGASSD